MTSSWTDTSSTVAPRGLDVYLPLKGVSQRVPGKNMRPFEGRPLFHTIVDTLSRAARVNTIHVNTDCDVIAESASHLDGVSIEMRKEHLRGHEVSMNRLIEDFLLDHEEIEHLAQTHCTNPLLSADTIDAAIKAYFESDVTSLFTVTRLQARFYDAELRAINHDPTNLAQTQDLEPVYVENSSFYIFERGGFLDLGTRITSKPMMWAMDPFEAIDIDEEFDFRMAEALRRAERLLGPGVPPNGPANDS